MKENNDEEIRGGSERNFLLPNVKKRKMHYSNSDGVSAEPNSGDRSKKERSVLMKEVSTQERRMFPRNIVHGLEQRRCHADFGRQFSPLHSMVPISWKHVDWLQFQGSQSLPHQPQQQFQSQNKITALSIDRMGVLLAVAYQDTFLRIYDWDTVRAMEIEGRNQRKRRKQKRGLNDSDAGESRAESIATIEPVLSLTVGSSPAIKLVWNPKIEDELLVATSSAIQIVDLQEVNAYKTIPCSCHKSTCMELLGEGFHLLLGTGNHLSCWDMGATSSPRQVWCLNWRAEITATAVLFDSRVLVASADGNVALLDWKSLQRATFSVRSTPQVLDEWVPSKGLDSPSVRHMAIRRFSLESSYFGQEQITTWNRGIRLVGCVTCCGWVLSMLVEPDRFLRNSIQVRYTTPPVRHKNFQGEDVNPPPQGGWSLPQRPVLAESIDGAVFWERVPQAIHYLSHQDRRVLDQNSCRGALVEDSSALLYMTLDQQQRSQLRTIRLAKFFPGAMSGFAIHPSLEWVIIIGNNDSQIYIVNARSKNL